VRDFVKAKAKEAQRERGTALLISEVNLVLIRGGIFGVPKLAVVN
jgi:hypothetical protein